MLILLSIDPGDHAAGLALYLDTGRGWRLHSSRNVQGSTTVPIDQEGAASIVFRMLRGLDVEDLAGTNVPALILTERHTNPNVTRATKDSLAASRRTWEQGAAQAFAAWGCKTEFHRTPAVWWQGAAGVSSKAAKLMGGTKGASCFRASQVAGHDVQSDDEADAIVMGEVWLAHGGVQGESDREMARRAKAAEQKTGKGRGGFTDEWLADLRARGMVE